MTSEPTTTSATTTTTDGNELDRVADRLVEQARTDGVALTGPGGLLGGLTKRVLETALA
jgi:ribosomal protein S10